MARPCVCYGCRSPNCCRKTAATGSERERKEEDKQTAISWRISLQQLSSTLLEFQSHSRRSTTRSKHYFSGRSWLVKSQRWLTVGCLKTLSCHQARSDQELCDQVSFRHGPVAAERMEATQVGWTAQLVSYGQKDNTRKRAENERNRQHLLSWLTYRNNRWPVILSVLTVTPTRKEVSMVLCAVSATFSPASAKFLDSVWRRQRPYLRARSRIALTREHFRWLLLYWAVVWSSASRCDPPGGSIYDTSFRCCKASIKE